MCDYSLHAVRSRPAMVGEQLVSCAFPNTLTRGFSSPGDPKVAVCLLAGTEVAFDHEVRYDGPWWPFRTCRAVGKVARFRHIDLDRPNVHHDALEFANGKIVLVDALREGQHATILQLPATSNAERTTARASASSDDAKPTAMSPQQ